MQSMFLAFLSVPNGIAEGFRKGVLEEIYWGVRNIFESS